MHPLNEGQECYGVDLRDLEEAPKFTLRYFLDFYHKFDNEKDFLTRERWLNLLAGTDELVQLVREGKNEREIMAQWQDGLNTFKETRKKYLLYPDFE